jgi:hypothetical protein
MWHNEKARRSRHSVMVVSLLTAAVPAAAQPPAEGSDIEVLSRRLEAETRKLEALRQSLEKEQKALQEQKLRLDQLRREVERKGAKQPVRLSDEAKGSLRGGQAAQGKAEQAQAEAQPQQQQATPAQSTPTTVGQAPEPSERPPEVAPLGQQPGVLTPKGALVLEPSLQYSYSTSDRVAIIGFSIIPAFVIGLIDVRTVNRSAWVAALAARYGITNRLEFEAKLPYVYRDDSTTARPFNTAAASDSQFNATGNGIGDVEFTARYQFNDGGLDRPYYIGTLRFKTRTGKDPFEVERESPFQGADQLEAELPTGSGFYSLQPGLTVLYPSDPAVFFGSLLYQYNFGRDVGNGFGEVEPGNIYEFNFGMGLALNEKASFSLGYDHSILTAPKVNGSVPAQATSTQIGQLALGYSYKLSPRTTLNASLAIGVTDQAPDVQLTLRVPIQTLSK